MFLENSRYVDLATVEATTRNGRTVSALTLRLPPPTPGRARQVHDGDRLDLIAHEKLADATRFWRVADANTALDSRRLTDTTGAEIVVPEKP